MFYILLNRISYKREYEFEVQFGLSLLKLIVETNSTFYTNIDFIFRHRRDFSILI